MVLTEHKILQNALDLLRIGELEQSRNKLAKVTGDTNHGK